jgi:hypothetical protein
VAPIINKEKSENNLAVPQAPLPQHFQRLWDSNPTLYAVLVAPIISATDGQNRSHWHLLRNYHHIRTISRDMPLSLADVKTSAHQISSR